MFRLITGPDGAILHPVALQKIFSDVMSVLRMEMDVKDSEGRPKFTDVCQFMGPLLQTPQQRATLQKQLEALDETCSKILAQRGSIRVEAAIRLS